MKKKKYLKKIADALQYLRPPEPYNNDFKGRNSFIWHTNPDNLEAISTLNFFNPDFLLGVDQCRSILIKNTEQFANGFAANNALLWGARGMGKSTLVKGVHSMFLNKELKLVEIKRGDLGSLDRLLGILRLSKFRFILFCDDLSFSDGDDDYKSLKTLLDGGIQSRLSNVIIYATSNQRHLMPRNMVENERSEAIYPSEAVEEKVSLSDRFGLWLGFYQCTQDQYLQMIKKYCNAIKIQIKETELRSEAIEWQQTRGSRSGRVAWQFVLDLAGRNGISAETVTARLK